MAICLDPLERRAERVRALQSGLMVAALKCVHRPDLYLRENYNTFVRQFGNELIALSQVFQDHFRDSYGSNYRYHLNKYVTSLANEYSLRTFQSDYFCQDMAELSEDVLDLSRADIYFARFNDRLLPPVGQKDCARPKAHPDFPHAPQMPDLVSIHMPDIDDRQMKQVHLQR